ncbi:integrase, partial [Rubrivivax gelatinosus]|nr:integrase [Rubrivivax gelatinosus]
MRLTPAITQRLVQIERALASAPRGGKQHVIAAACAELGVSHATLHRYLAAVAVRPERRQRSDAGTVALTRAEAVAVSAMLMASQRKTNKRLLSIGQAVEILRANGEISAERVDPASGEVKLLSDSAIARALRSYG